MLGEQNRTQDEMFVSGTLHELIPEDYILKKVDRVLDLSWLRAEVADLYCATNGRPSIDPEAAVRLMLAGFFHGLVHDRALMREARMHLGMRWFAGFALHESLPDHSSLTRLRQRWGAERFRRIFERTVGLCIQAGLVDGQTVHIDATLIRADVSWESISLQHAEQVWEANQDASGEMPPKPVKPPKRKKRSSTDPECTLTTSTHDVRMQPSYKQHTAVDDRAGVIVDIDVTTGEASEGKQLMQQLQRVEATLGHCPQVVTADTGYASGRNLKALESRGIEAFIPPHRVTSKSDILPIERFKYDERHDWFKCPAGKKLTPHSGFTTGRFYRAQRKDCEQCPLRSKCLAPQTRRRSLTLSEGYPALLRMRRRQKKRDSRWRHFYTRHRWLVEGRHGEAKTQHGLARAVRRGLNNVAIQAYLTAAVMNLKRLARTCKAPEATPERCKTASGVFARVFRLFAKFIKIINADNGTEECLTNI